MPRVPLVVVIASVPVWAGCFAVHGDRVDAGSSGLVDAAPRACAIAEDCRAGELCARVPGACGAVGECAAPPSSCSRDCSTVCGCDGRTHCNDCEAARAGTSVAGAGACDDLCDGRACPAGSRCCPDCAGALTCIVAGDRCPELACGTACADDEDCVPDELCRFERGACGTAGAMGRCEPRPGPCGTLDCELVCGCDGRPYCSECEAHRAGTSVLGSGPCPPPPCGERADGCADDEYCGLGPECGADPTCATRPTECVVVDDPVCGCDGRTYAHACLAASRGVTVASSGACPSPPRTCFEVQLSMTNATSGVYTLAPEGEPRRVLCDMETDGGGWTLVAVTWREALDDRAGPYHDELTTIAPSSPHPWVWDGLRAVVGPRTDMRFTCRSSAMRDDYVDLSFYDVPWYREITTGTDAESCFSENDGEGFEGPAPARRENLSGQYLPLGTPWAAGYLEGEDSCDSETDFSVDLRDRGLNGDEWDGTDWGEDDTAPKCGWTDARDGYFAIWIREP